MSYTFKQPINVIFITNIANKHPIAFTFYLEQ